LHLRYGWIIVLVSKVGQNLADGDVISRGLCCCHSIPFYIKTFGFYDWARKSLLGLGKPDAQYIASMKFHWHHPKQQQIQRLAAF
jgi:hypothetical protein